MTLCMKVNRRKKVGVGILAFEPFSTHFFHKKCNVLSGHRVCNKLQSAAERGSIHFSKSINVLGEQIMQF